MLWVGQERFRTLTPSFYRGAHAVIVCYDIANAKSFQNVQRWLQDVGGAARNVSLRLVFVTLYVRAQSGIRRVRTPTRCPWSK